MYKVSIAGVFDALVIAVSIAAALVLTAALNVVIAEGTLVSASAFLTMYQSVSCNIPAAWDLTILIFCVFKPSTLTSPSVPNPLSSSSSVNKVSAWAFAVASPYEAVTLPLPKA